MDTFCRKVAEGEGGRGRDRVEREGEAGGRCHGEILMALDVILEPQCHQC
jgi:hypothetical protein